MELRTKLMQSTAILAALLAMVKYTTPAIAAAAPIFPGSLGTAIPVASNGTTQVTITTGTTGGSICSLTAVSLSAAFVATLYMTYPTTTTAAVVAVTTVLSQGSPPTDLVSLSNFPGLWQNGPTSKPFISLPSTSYAIASTVTSAAGANIIFFPQCPGF